jgi:hypothetical protein
MNKEHNPKPASRFLARLLTVAGLLTGLGSSGAGAAASTSRLDTVQVESLQLPPGFKINDFA